MLCTMTMPHRLPATPKCGRAWGRSGCVAARIGSESVGVWQEEDDDDGKAKKGKKGKGGTMSKRG